MAKLRRPIAIVAGVAAGLAIIGPLRATGVHAATAGTCVNNHTWTIPYNTVGLNLTPAPLAETYVGQACVNVDTSATPAVFFNGTTGTFIQSAFTYAGNCVVGIGTYPQAGNRIFLGNVSVAFGALGTTVNTAVGIGVVPSTIPCTGGTLTWTGYENFSHTP